MIFSPLVKILILLTIVCSIPSSLNLYIVLRSISVGLPELVIGRGPLDLGEGYLQTVPLRGVLLMAFGDGKGVGEGRVVGPEGEFLTSGRPAKSWRPWLC
jgi:hypothetical protein